MQDSTDKLFADASTNPLTATLNGSGQISVNSTVGIVLIANDDTTTQPTGSTWVVTENITGSPSRTYDVVIPHAAPGGTIDLSQLSPSTSTPTYSYVLVTSVGVANGVASTGPVGVVPLSQLATGTPTPGYVPTAPSSGASAAWGPGGGGGGTVTSPNETIKVTSGTEVDINFNLGLSSTTAIGGLANWATFAAAGPGGLGVLWLTDPVVTVSTTLVIPSGGNLEGLGWANGYFITQAANADCAALSATGAAQWFRLANLRIVKENAQTLGDWHSGLLLDTTSASDFDTNALIERVAIKNQTGEGINGTIGGHGEITYFNVYCNHNGGSGHFQGNFDNEHIACKYSENGLSGSWNAAGDNSYADCHFYNSGTAVPYTNGLNWAAGAATIYLGCIYIAASSLTAYSGTPSTDTANWLAPQRPMYGAGRGTQNQAPDYGVGVYVTGSDSTYAGCSSEQNSTYGLYVLGKTCAFQGNIIGINFNQATSTYNSTNPNDYAGVALDGSAGGAFGCTITVSMSLASGTQAYALKLINGAINNTIIINGSGWASVFSPDTSFALVMQNTVIVNGQVYGLTEWMNEVLSPGATLALAYIANDVTLSANLTMTMPTATPGAFCYGFFRQPSTGGTYNYTVSFTGVNWPGGSPPTLTTGAGAYDRYDFVCDANGQWNGLVSGQAF